MSAARDEVLGRVRAALADRGPAEAAPRTYRRAGRLDRAARVGLLTERLVDYGARVERAREDEIGRLVAQLVPDRAVAVPPGLPYEWRPTGIVEDRGLATHELDALGGVVTGCTVAIAETGTLVLSGGPTEGRRTLTLVPDVHVCVVRTGQIVETVPEAFAALAGRERQPLTFISGPSATSDIELKRVEGVHGPRMLVVVIVDEAGRRQALPVQAVDGNEDVARRLGTGTELSPTVPRRPSSREMPRPETS